MIEKYLAAEADKLSQKFLDGAKTIDEWKKKRPRLHQEYLDMLGLWPLPEKTPLKATVTGTLESQGAIIEKVHFQSKPGLYVTANFYRPKDARARNGKRLPTILYVCGHAGRGRDGNKSAYQDHGLWFANNGYNCLILDTLQLGEIPGIHHGTYGIRNPKEKDKEAPTRFWWHSAGYTPAGVECWNGIRALDYLQSRDDVDPGRIGVTGISGGGATTFWIAAADERIKVAVPVSGMSDLDCYVKQKIINGHCDCMFLYNTYQWDWTTIAALVAPRPMLFVNSDNDPIFPMDGNRRISEKLRKIYDIYGKAEHFDDYVSEGGHDYRKGIRIAVFRFMNKHLKGEPSADVQDANFEKIPGRELRVFPEDTDIPKDAINGKIDETFVPKAKVALPEKGKFAEWKKRLLSEVRSKSFLDIPQPIPAAKKTGDIGSEKSMTLETEVGISVLMAPPALSPNWNEKISVDIKVFVPCNLEQMKPRYQSYWEELGKVGQVALFPRGSMLNSVNEPFVWSENSPPNYVRRSHLLLGKTVDQRRVLDIAVACRSLAERSEKGKKLEVIGFRESGILAAYAALFEPSIKEVVIIDPPKSHMEGPHFLGILRVLDIPEALGLLAPTPLTIIGGQDRAFDRTEEIYRLAGAADKLKRK